MASFHERQHMRMLWVWALLLTFAVGAWVVFGGHLFFGLEFDDPPPRWMSILFLVIFGVGFPLLPWWFRLDVTVDHDELAVSMFPGHCRRVLLGDVERAEAVQFRPMAEYMGWGMRWSPGKGWCYTMQGNRGVRVHLRSGKTFLVGSERGDELAAAIQPQSASGAA